MNKLLPCPLCGAEALDMGGDHCCCSSDGCALGEMGNMMSIHRDEWNTRHTPEGWQLVPVEFTKEQDEACEIEWRDADEWSDLYTAMLAAAPKWGGE